MTMQSPMSADIARREAERMAVQQIVAKLEKTVPLARQRAQDYKDLVDKAFISRHGYLEKEQERIEQEGDLATQEARLNELAAAIAEGRSQRLALLAETRRIALESLGYQQRRDAEQKRVAFDQEELKADSRGRQMTLTAPVAGTVQQLAVNTVGGANLATLTPAQAPMVIVPCDNLLEVEAILDNKDIGFVSAGQEAEIKIETFPFTKYGTIPGHVTQVSGDAIADEQRGLIFVARVSLEKTELQVDQRLVPLQPGMAVTVEIKTGDRRVIEYFLSPLLRAGDESLRER